MFNRIIVKLAAFSFISCRLRARLLNGRVGMISENVQRINSNCYFRGKRIMIDEGVFINVFCRFFSHEAEGSDIIINKNCVLGMGVTIDTHTHEIEGEKRRASFETIFKPVVIGEGSWIGANVLILPGVRIGKGTVIGAGSVVVKDCESNSVYVGNPAKKVRELDI